jgi:hypothetical protein
MGLIGPIIRRNADVSDEARFHTLPTPLPMAKSERQTPDAKRGLHFGRLRSRFRFP